MIDPPIQSEELHKRNMSKEDVIEMQGEIVENLPNATFRVKLENGHIVLEGSGGDLLKNEHLKTHYLGI